MSNEKANTVNKEARKREREAMVTGGVVAEEVVEDAEESSSVVSDRIMARDERDDSEPEVDPE